MNVSFRTYFYTIYKAKITYFVSCTKKKKFNIFYVIFVYMYIKCLNTISFFFFLIAWIVDVVHQPFGVWIVSVKCSYVENVRQCPSSCVICKYDVRFALYGHFHWLLNFHNNCIQIEISTYATEKEIKKKNGENRNNINKNVKRYSLICPTTNLEIFDKFYRNTKPKIWSHSSDKNDDRVQKSLFRC